MNLLCGVFAKLLKAEYGWCDNSFFVFKARSVTTRSCIFHWTYSLSTGKLMNFENLRWQLVSSFFQQQFCLNAICCLRLQKGPTAPIQRFYKFTHLWRLAVWHLSNYWLDHNAFLWRGKFSEVPLLSRTVIRLNCYSILMC